MQSSSKRTLGVVIALAALVGGFFASVAVHRFHDRALRRLAAQLTTSTRAQARAALDNKLKLLEGEAMAAAQLPQIRGQLTNFDAPTLRDGFRSEPWWQSFRNDFSVYGLALESDKLEALEGLDKFEADPLVREARAHRTSSALLLAGPTSWPYAAAASVVDTPGRAVQAVIVLGRPIDQVFAEELAQALQGPVLVTDGKSPLLAAGKEPQLTNLKTSIGQEALPIVEAEDASWAAAPQPLLPGLTLWTYSALGAQEAEYRRDEAMARGGVWAFALLVAGAALFLGLRRRGPSHALLGAPGGLAAEPAPPAPDVTGGMRTPVALPVAGTSGTSGPPRQLESEGATSVQMAPPKPDPANVFGRYVLLDRLGEGGMAEVYTAVTYGAESFRRKFVIKRLRPEMAGRKDVVSAFIDEANLASSLVHSNIVPVFDFGKLGDEYYMAQEYILGRDLGRVSRGSLEKEQRPLPQAQVFYVAHETLKALDYAHHRLAPDGSPLGLVHRDVSPNNILVSARGEVKLFDFGIAKAEGRITQTQFGTVKGNVRFMSPEQARGDGVDSRSDLFAIGLVIYYALSGEALYEGDNAYALLLRAAQGPGEKELAALAALPPQARHLLERALQLEVGARFQTALEFMTALAPYLAGGHEALTRSMERLFGEEFKSEEARFSSAAAAGAPTTPAPAGDSGATTPSTQRFAVPGKP